MIPTTRVRDHLQQLGFTIGKDLSYYLAKGATHDEKSW